MTETTANLISDAARAEIDKWVKKYPPEQKQSAVLTALHLVQEENGGWLTNEHLTAVANYLEMPPIAVYEVATFYSMFELKPVGLHKISVCTNISCMLSDCKKITDHLQQRLQINFGETTADGKFTLREVECLAACANAPMMQIDKTYHLDLTPEKVDKILDELE